MSQNGYAPYGGYADTYYNSNSIQRARSYDGRPGYHVATAHQGPSSHSTVDRFSSEKAPTAKSFDLTSLTGFPDFAGGSVPISNTLDPFPTFPSEPPVTDPIANFYRGDDGPWNSFAARTRNPSSVQNLAVPSFHAYRDIEAPGSEISDSGYGTQAAATQSIISTDPLDFGKDCTEISQNFNGLHLPSLSGASPRSTALGSSPHLRTVGFKKRASARKSLNKHICDSCFHEAKCPSDLKKHKLKHDKPFKCDREKCIRKDGFTTVNDLHRHMKSVHKVGAGPTKSYRCAAKDCKHKDKVWPRLDNFKQHVTRMHQDDNVEDMVNRSIYNGPLTENPASSSASRVKPLPSMDTALLAGMDPKSKHPNEASPTEGKLRGFSITSDQTHPEFEDEHLPYSSDRLFHGVRTQPDQTYLPPSITFDGPQSGSSRSLQHDGVPSTGLNDSSRVSTLADAATISATGPVPDGGNAGGNQSAPQRPTANAKAEASRRTMSHVSKLIADSISRRQGEPLEQAVLRAFEDMGAAPSATRHRKSAASQNAATQFTDTKTHGSGNAQARNEAVDTISSAEVLKGLKELSKLIRQSGKKPPLESGHQCPHPTCRKLVKRQCDLKKHEKRHTKPWGCTFPSCAKKFGSKNDWKRHENSQHFQLETWRCELPLHSGSGTDTDTNTAASAPCAKLFYHKDVFDAHLGDPPHALLDPAQRAYELKARRIGRNSQSRFWCGFCRAIVALERKGVEAWDERFDHIDAHFKDGDDIADWLDLETNAAKKEALSDRDRSRFADEDPLESESSESDHNAPSEGGGGGGGARRRLRASRKRGREEDGPDGRLHKRGKADTQLFFCCQCPDGENGPYCWKLFKSCLHCQHPFCEHCDRKMYGGNDIDFDIFAHQDA